MTVVLPPLVEAYLADLERALLSTNPRERAETLVAVRDHVTESLAGRVDDDDAVAQVLDDLGSVEEIAAAASPATDTAVTTSMRGDGWLLACSIAGFVLLWFPPVALASLIWAIAALRSRNGDRTRQLAALWISIAALVCAAIAAAMLLQAGTSVVGTSVVTTA